jgi:hypothetical protein
MWLPAQALLKEVLLGLGLPGATLAAAADEISAESARRLTARLREAPGEGGGCGGASALFWNLALLFSRRRLPAEFLLWGLALANALDRDEGGP